MCTIVLLGKRNCKSRTRLLERWRLEFVIQFLSTQSFLSLSFYPFAHLFVSLCLWFVLQDRSNDLSHSLRVHCQDFIHRHPLVAPSSDDRDSDISESEVKTLKRWSLWSKYFQPPTRMPKPETTNNSFQHAVEQLRKHMEKVN